MRVALFGMLAACGFRGPPATPNDGVALDAFSVDATADAAPCPSTYTGGYRFERMPHTWLEAERACEADAPGASHLVVINDDAERLVVGAAITADAYVGIVREPGGTSPWPWRYVTGGAATFALWEPIEPNNLSGDQYIAAMRQTSQQLYDYGITTVGASMCECDGQPPVNADYDPATP